MTKDILTSLSNLSPDCSAPEKSEAYWKGFADAALSGPDLIDEMISNGLGEIGNLLMSQFTLVAVPTQYESIVIGEYLCFHIGGNFYIMHEDDVSQAVENYQIIPLRSL